MRDDEAQAPARAARTEDGERYLAGAGLGAESGAAAVGQTTSAIGAQDSRRLVPSAARDAAKPHKAEGLRLMEAVVERSNLWRAYERVLRNKGAAGVDGVLVTELKPWLQRHWPSVKAALLAGDYLPQAVRAVEIPKPCGGVRLLGIPTVVDRLIQQALLQILQPLFEPEFSESSYGFIRPFRGAHPSGASLWLFQIAPGDLVGQVDGRGTPCKRRRLTSWKAGVGWWT